MATARERNLEWETDPRWHDKAQEGQQGRQEETDGR
jgi:hypothetical protein